MAELSKGKQHVRNHKPSGLRHVEQVPDSDFVVPETQLDADGFGSVELYSDDAAFLEHHQVKRSSQHLLPQTFGVGKPDSATIVGPAFSFERAPNMASPKPDAPALQPSNHHATVVLSIEHDDGGSQKQDANVTHTESLASPSPTIEEHTAIETSKGKEALFVQHQFPRSSYTSTKFVDIGGIEHMSGFRPSVTDTVTQSTSNPALKLVSIKKNTRVGRKTKKGKKALISGPLVPWPPQRGHLPDGLNTPPITGSFTDPTSLELKAESSGSTHDVADLAVKPQNSGIHVPINGLSDTEVQSSFIAEKILRCDIFDNTPASNQHHVEDSVHVNLPGETQHTVFLESSVLEPINITDPSDTPEDPSSYTSYEGHVRLLQTREASEAGADLQDRSIFACKPMAPHSRTDSKTHHVLGAESSQPSDSNQQTSSNPLMTNLDPVREPSLRSRDVHTGLHEPSSREGSICVTKTQKKIHPSYVPHSRTSVAVSNHQATSRMTALEVALNSIRTACLVDQSRMENQMASAVNALKQEKVQLESTILDQQTAINELRMQQKTSKQNLTRLTEKAKTIQKYVSGLQDDHEKCQKLVEVFQEQNRQTLQDRIADIAKEKADLQSAFNQAVDSFKKSRSKMIKMMNETYAQYKAALSRNGDLEERLTELTSMYKAEKARSTEIENQLVPSLQSVQRHLSESAVTLSDKLSNMDATLAHLASEDRNDCGIKHCLRILQKMESTPLLTANDARKAEGMLRFVYERMNAGFELLAKTVANESCSIEDVRKCMRDQIQILLAEISRRDQAMADRHLAPEATESIKLELVTLKQDQQQLEDQIISLRQSEAALESHRVQLETERDELQTALREHQAQAHQSGLDMTQLQNELNQTKKQLLLVSDTARRNERLRLEREQEFFSFRSQAMARFNGLKEEIQHMKTQLQAKEREYDALQEDLTGSKATLESVQSNFDQLTVEVSQYKTTADTLRQERDHIDEEHGITRASLRSAEQRSRVLEADTEILTATLKEARTSLCESVDAKASLNAAYSDLQRQLCELQDAKDASDEQLQKVQRNAATGLQQTKQDYIAQVEDLQSRLSVSEDDRKDSHAKVRRMEVAHSQQLECHRQEAKARFEHLASESERIREELEAEHEQALERQQQEADAKMENLQRQIDEMQAGTTSKVLVPNSQTSFAHDSNSNALHQSHPGKTRKKVDRQTNSVVVVPSSNLRLDTDERRPIADRSNLPHSRREGSEHHQTGFFEEEYRNRFGPQITLHEHENSLPLMDPDTETVPETQGIQFAQGSTAQFVVVESQVSVGGNTNQEEVVSELSSMPSEDLSEMLLDIRSDSGRQRDSSRHLASPKNTVRTPKCPEQEISSDAPSSTSQDRPKSRANTASRMAPLPVHDMQRQRVQAHDLAQDQASARPNRSFRADSDHPPNPMHTNNATLKHNHAQLVSVYAGTQAGSTDTGHKRKSTDDIEQVAPSKKLRAAAQSLAQRPSSISKSYAPYTPSPTGAVSHPDANSNSPSATGRRSSNRSSSNAGSQTKTPRFSSTRNTRSKKNQYADRFGQELDGR